MTIPPEGQAPWMQVIDELKRMRLEGARREEELWEAVEEIRSSLRTGEGQPGAGRPQDGHDDEHRLAPAAYRRLKRRARSFVAGAVPEGARVAIVSRGDPDLLDIPGIVTEHFPRQPTGSFTGFYPSDGLGAIAHLEWVRAEGADYLFFPATASWWLDRFPLFASHLRAYASQVAERDGVGTLFRLGDEARGGSARATDRVRDLVDAWAQANGRDVAVLDWGTGLELSARLPGRTVFSPPDPEVPLPYLDGTVDVVVITGDDPAKVAEAHRVAAKTVVRFPEGGDLEAEGRGHGGDGVMMEHCAGAPPSLPSTTVVIPTFDGLRNVIPCVAALARTLPADFDGEVVVVDDCSGTETARGLARLEREHAWLHVLRNSENEGFIGSCNRGAEAAHGDFLVFLNDDTVPLGGWLAALLRTFRLHPDAGAVGGRLVYPDGRLQEAGGLIFSDGTGANFGRGDYEVDAPLYGHVRRVDYCSGALLATPRALFVELGGFDARYRPAYYEDTDYCFTVRSTGLEVYYQPEAVVVHVEGATSGTDTSTGAKRYQVRNRRIFRHKWRADLAERGPAPGEYDAETWHRLALGGGAA